jgi:hypothetical protein
MEEYLLEFLRTFGLQFQSIKNKGFSFKILIEPGNKQLDIVLKTLKSPSLTLIIKPQSDFINYLSIQKTSIEIPRRLFSSSKNLPNFCFKTLHSYESYQAQCLQSLLTDQDNNHVWSLYKVERSFIIIIGTDIIKDLITFQQGNRLNLSQRNNKLWGFNFERPNYLYEGIFNPLQPYRRYADEWGFFLASVISITLDIPLQPILPNNAKGAIIITGDDDQAYLDKYKKQLDILGKDTPITYFMHPLTRHTQETFATMLNNPNIDIGIHPDALDMPDKYGTLFGLQASWFRGKFGKNAASVRNHGYLNDGYWGHLKYWLQEKVHFSSNIPGLDGNILSGSLLPTRVYHNNVLTYHYSILTAIGDGLIFIHGINDKQGKKYIYNLADSILNSPIPGIIVINLHPQNIDLTLELHYAVLDLIKNGFYPMTMSSCLDWVRFSRY